MPKYVALLRGIAPTNPNMRNEKLRAVFEALGFTKVKTVISSGNVLFESDHSDIGVLEKMIEHALPEQLGFTSTTIIRSQQQLEHLVATDPFSGRLHTPATYLTVTFLKHRPGAYNLPPNGPGHIILSGRDQAIFSIVDTTAAKTPDLMAQLERHFGKEITTRTWLTVQRILKGFDSLN